MGEEIVGTAEGADFGAGIEIDLDVGIRENDAADIAAFHDDAGARGDVALEFHHDAAYGWQSGDEAGGGGDFGSANQIGDVFPVEEDAVVARVELDLGIAGKDLNTMRVIEGDLGTDRPEGSCAIHGTGVDVDCADAGGDAAGDGALSGTGRPVDGDDETSGQFPILAEVATI